MSYTVAYQRPVTQTAALPEQRLTGHTVADPLAATDDSRACGHACANMLGMQRGNARNAMLSTAHGLVATHISGTCFITD
jgi:hypothetical protein